MAYNVKMSSLAEQNVDNALAYYSDVSLSVAESFFTSLNESLLILKTNPFFEVRYQKVRVLPLKKFPFLLLFEVDEADKTVLVLSVFNTYQSTDKYP